MSLNRLNLKWILALVAFLLIVGYALFEARNLLDGPSLEIISPKTGTIVEDSLLSIQGQAKNISKIFLNGRQIFTDENGHFHETLLLSVGYNIIVVRALDQIGRTISRQTEIVLR